MGIFGPRIIGVVGPYPYELGRTIYVGVVRYIRHADEAPVSEGEMSKASPWDMAVRGAPLPNEL